MFNAIVGQDRIRGKVIYILTNQTVVIKEIQKN